MGENTINKLNYLWPISSGGDLIIIHVIFEVWIWRGLITLVSCYGWTGCVNITPCSRRCVVKGQRGSERRRRWTPPSRPQRPSLLHREGSSIAIDERSAGATDSSNGPTNDEDRWIKISEQTIWRWKGVSGDGCTISHLKEAANAKEDTGQQQPH